MSISGSPTGMIRVQAGRTAAEWAVGDDGRLHQIGFGPSTLSAIADFPTGLYPLAFPTFGEEPLREPALRVTHADGTTSTRLRVVDVSTESVGSFTEGESEAVTRIRLADRVAPLGVDLLVRSHPDHDLLEMWAEVTNHGPGTVTVHRLMAASPAFAGADPHMIHWGGGWAGEWTETTERLTPGVKTVGSAGGVRASLYRPPIVLFAPDGPPAEESGRVGACTVMWGGDIRFDAEVFLHGQIRLLAGHHDRGSERQLDSGETFESPHVLWTWSESGVGPTSRALHDFVRTRVIRDGQRPRAIVVNTWEAVGFSLDPVGLANQVDRAAELGAELFLLDDGWFGTTHPRNDDTTGLGDWDTDLAKLPGGLQPLIDHTVDRGLRFGLWVEPEMVNPASSLYENHPDWVVSEPGRERREERQQLILDLCRPEVRRFVVETIDTILTRHPAISYLKWDANRDLTEPGSGALAADRQSHMAVDRVRHLWDVMAEVADRHPDVEVMACASGGGRSDLGTLRWCHELWTSDNTDPIDRLRIQWGASHLLPAMVLGAHVTRWGGRPVAFGAMVALSGRFGFDLDLTALNDHERAIARRATEVARRIRPLVQFGELHRLVSPLVGDRSALAYRASGGGSSVVFLYRSAAGVPGTGLKVPWLVGTGDLRAWDLSVDHEPREIVITDGMIDWPAGPEPSARVVEVDHPGI